MENFFTPLGKEYCDYFYITMVISFVILVVSVFSSIYLVFTGRTTYSRWYFRFSNTGTFIFK